MIVHIHIYKNGGTTFNQILKRRFGKDFVAWYPDQDALKPMSEIEMQEFIQAHPHAQAIASHRLRFPCPPLPGIQYQYVTFIRHPLARALSMYAYERAHILPAKPNHRSARPLEEYLQMLEQKGFTKRQCEHLHPSKTFEKAIEVLSQFTVVGLVERYDESLALISHKLGIPLRAMIQPRANVSMRHSAKQMLRAEHYQALTRADAPDMQLWVWANRRLDEELRAMNRRFFFNVGLLRVANQGVYRERIVRGYVRGKCKGLMRRLHHLCSAVLGRALSANQK